MEGKLALAAISAEKAYRNQVLSFGSQKRRVEQFLMVKPIIFRLWQAVIDAFGYPTLKIGSGGSEA